MALGLEPRLALEAAVIADAALASAEGLAAQGILPSRDSENSGRLPARSRETLNHASDELTPPA